MNNYRKNGRYIESKKVYRNFREIIAIGFPTDLDASIKNERMKSSRSNVNRRQRGEVEGEREGEGESEKEREREREELVEYRRFREIL